MKEFEKTKGYSNFRGIIGGLTAIKEGKSKWGFVEDEKKKSLQFSVKTSDNNVHYIRINQWKTGKAMDSAWISKKDEESGKFETIKINWDDRLKKLEDGWRLIGIALKSANDEYTQNFVAYDAIDYILENFEDGDAVFVGVENSYYEGQNGTKNNYDLKKMFYAKDGVDFEAEDFEETADFEQTIIFNNCYPDADGLVINAFTVGFTGELCPTQFLVKNIDKEVIKYFEKEIKIGDVLNVFGVVNNRVEYELIKIESEESSGNSLGRKTKSVANREKPKYEKNILFEEKNLQITGLDIDSIEQGKYTEDDLLGDEFDEDEVPF